MMWIRPVVVLFAACAALSGCRHTPDEEQVRKAITATSDAAEAGKAGGTVEALTEDFDGNGGQLDKRGLSNLIRVSVLKNQKIHALMGPITVEARGQRMQAHFTVTLSAGTNVLPDDAGAYVVDTGWRKENGHWRCFTAMWKKAL